MTGLPRPSLHAHDDYSSGVILHTTDGAQEWATQYVSTPDYQGPVGLRGDRLLGSEMVHEMRAVLRTTIASPVTPIHHATYHSAATSPIEVKATHTAAITSENRSAVADLLARRDSRSFAGGAYASMSR